MRAVVQRVCEASVIGRRRGRRRPAGAGSRSCSASRGRREAEAERLAGKVARLRIFENEDGKFDRSLLDVGGEALVVSQFTLIADTRKGNRPSFTTPRRPRSRSRSTNASVTRSRTRASASRTGVFGARMEVSLVNDGPVTIVLDA